MAGKRSVVDARADKDGNIEAVKLEGNRQFTSVSVAVGMAERGELSNVHAVHPAKGKPFLRANPNQRKGDNLDEMAKR